MACWSNYKLFELAFEGNQWRNISPAWWPLTSHKWWWDCFPMRSNQICIVHSIFWMFGNLMLHLLTWNHIVMLYHSMCTGNLVMLVRAWNQVLNWMCMKLNVTLFVHGLNIIVMSNFDEYYMYAWRTVNDLCEKLYLVFPVMLILCQNKIIIRQVMLFKNCYNNIFILINIEFPSVIDIIDMSLFLRKDLVYFKGQ